MCIHHMREDIEGSYALEAGSTTPCHPHPGSKDGGLSRADRHRTPEPRTGRRPGPPDHFPVGECDCSLSKNPM